MLIWGGSLGLALIWHGHLITLLLRNGASDSFYTLSLVHRTGLMFYSGFLIAILYWISDSKSRWLQNKLAPQHRFLLPACLFDIALSSALFLIFYIVSPQLYYLYYQIIIPGLDWQWVVGTTSLNGSNFTHLAMRSVGNYSQLLSGLTLWTLVFAVIWQYLALSRSPKPGLRAALYAGAFALFYLITAI